MPSWITTVPLRTYLLTYACIFRPIRAAPSERMSLSMRKMHRFRFIIACAKSHPGICPPLIHWKYWVYYLHSIVSNDSVSGQQKPWSDCADAQADLGLRCRHMTKDTFSHGTAYLVRTYWRHGFDLCLIRQHSFVELMKGLQWEIQKRQLSEKGQFSVSGEYWLSNSRTKLARKGVVR